MLNVSLRHLRYFAALARFQHFGHAAQDCSVTQPALSMQIKELEVVLGVALFEKGSRPVQLTPVGQKIAAHIKPILQSIEQIDDIARADDSSQLNVLRIGVIPTIAPYIFSQIIQNLNNTYPKLDIKMRETITPHLIDAVLDGQLDTAILALPVSEPRLYEHPLMTEEFLLVRPSQDAHLPVPSPQTLLQMRLLLLEEGHCFRDQALSFCTATQTLPRNVMDGSSLSTLVQMVDAGLGVTLIPEMALNIEQRNSNIITQRFGSKAPKRTIGMVWRKSSAINAKLLEISKIVAQVCLGSVCKSE